MRLQFDNSLSGSRRPSARIVALAVIFALASIAAGAQEAGDSEVLSGDDGARDSRKWRFSGDLRAGYNRAERDRDDGSSTTSSSWLGRFRFRAGSNLGDWLAFNARIAASCSSDDCSPSLVFEPNIPRETTVDDGDVTFDELYVRGSRGERLDVAIGRLQTKFVARAGVFAKSLDRNDSNGFRINWTNGVHAAYRLEDKSIVHLILEYNDSDGPSNVKRGPMDFTDDGSRVGYFLAWENLERWGPITQRGIDVTYLPKALLKDGTRAGPVDDYLGAVARFASSRPFGAKGRRWMLAGEIGYAPETPTESAVGLPGDRDAGGIAWTLAASIMDIWPSHSIGINYGRVDPGWLLSPQYRDNEELFEVRYLWRDRPNLSIEVRVRYREELERREVASRRQDELDGFARLTIGFGAE